jgi:hypothetical protein
VPQAAARRGGPGRWLVGATGSLPHLQQRMGASGRWAGRRMRVKWRAERQERRRGARGEMERGLEGSRRIDDAATGALVITVRTQSDD